MHVIPSNTNLIYESCFGSMKVNTFSVKPESDVSPDCEAV